MQQSERCGRSVGRKLIKNAWAVWEGRGDEIQHPERKGIYGVIVCEHGVAKRGCRQMGERWPDVGTHEEATSLCFGIREGDLGADVEALESVS